MVAGGRLDFDSLESWCAASSQVESPDYDNNCVLLALKDKFADILGLGDVPAGLWPSTEDSRIDAVIVMTPGRVPTMGFDDFANITVAALVMVGANDQVNAAPANVLFAYKYAGSAQKALIEFENVNHFVFGACPAFWVAGGFPFCFDSVWDVDRAHDLINHFTTAFLLAELKGDEAARVALGPEAVAFPDITYESVGF